VAKLSHAQKTILVAVIILVSIATFWANSSRPSDRSPITVTAVQTATVVQTASVVQTLTTGMTTTATTTRSVTNTMNSTETTTVGT